MELRSDEGALEMVGSGDSSYLQTEGTLTDNALQLWVV
jgi:hypothetical protein